MDPGFWLDVDPGFVLESVSEFLVELGSRIPVILIQEGGIPGKNQKLDPPGKALESLRVVVYLFKMTAV